ncbi:MAG TPA: glycosyltransferase family 1 protein [Gemmataceae bacterium]|jgi:alpha-1,3-rhamnosyl/mannosyltransferase|nr:glycosyltransferase family 1 protein [Gemmataceae bacterium]
MLRVAFHQTPALRARTGVGHYTAQLLAALRNLPVGGAVAGVPGGLLATLYQSATALTGSSGCSARTRLRSTLVSASRTAEGLYFRQVAGRLALGRFDLYHEPNLPILRTELPTVVTVHDLSPLRFPEFQPAERARKFAQQLPAIVNRTAHIVTVSDFSRDEIIRILGVPPERVTRTYLGVRPELRPLPAALVQARLRRLGLPASYLLFVGTLEPRKNLLTLLDAYARLPAKLRERCPLVLVGGWGWNFEPIAGRLAEVRPLGVVHLGYVAESDLAVLYNGARALVLPSHYEGFGLPPLEMMACGGPVLASTAGALAEIFGDTAHLIPAENGDGWTAALGRIIGDDDWRRELCRDVRETAAKFTWQRCAEETNDVYRRVLLPGSAWGRGAGDEGAALAGTSRASAKR